MSTRPEAMPATPPIHRRPASERQRALDDRWNRQMTRLLREAAAGRERRERARAIKDDRAARREAAVILELIRARGRPKAKATLHAPPRDERRDQRS